MNRTNSNTGHPAKLLVAVAVSLVLAACASAPVKSTGAADARAKLTVLQSDPNLASRAPVQMSEAVAAVTAAEVVSQGDQEQAAHLAYLADRKVDTARARAEASLAEDQRAKLAQQRDSARLDARTREADTAKNRSRRLERDGHRQGPGRDGSRRAGLGAHCSSTTDRRVAAADRRAAGQANGSRLGADSGRCAVHDWNG